MIRTTLLSASLVALSACTTLGPKTDPVSHGITLPAAYDHAGTTAEERQDEQAWWADFGSEALDGLVAEALSTNQTLAGGIANVDAARAALKVSNASLLPQASGSVSASSDTEAGLGDVSSSARLSASYQLDLFGANAAALEASRASLEATEFAQRTLELTVQSDVASTYFSLLAAREQLRVAEQNLEISERIFKIVEVKYAAGAISGYDVSSQRAQLANSRARIPELESQITGLETSLAILLGRTPQGYEAPDEKILDIALPAAGSGLPSDLLLRRPDLRQAEASLRASNANVTAARAAFFPSIDLGAGVSSLLSGGSNLTGSLSASLAQTIFSGGRLEGQLEGAKARREAQLASYREAILNALRDVDVSLTSIEANARRQEQLLIARDASLEALDAAELRYRSGTDDLTSLLSAQQSYFTASDNYVQGRLSQLTAALNLYVALGGNY
ncbi:MAG: efflux transporter outer membrane subunit [Rhodobiaceae bacterium]|nr:efflux transporter outer membrane subunit [Hyphomonas sp.]MCB9961625.1 efflux transporter outer membrane subunit [Hyphomonas sp.]MCB9971182.1 efflux transporter outer membrane subunit [Hyphomonas sp.]MCC0050251.1 efflux transporter outer membrane subunit [Rhodobiaceae bacterium]